MAPTGNGQIGASVARAARGLLHVSSAMAMLAVATAAAAFVTIAVDAGSKWDDRNHGTPAVVTWGFVTDGTTVDASLAGDMTGGSQISQMRATYDAQYGAGAYDAAIARAFDTWAEVADIQFVGPVPDGGGPMGTPGSNDPDIRIGAFQPVPGSGFSFAGAFGFGPPGDDLNFPDALAGDVFFNVVQPFLEASGAEDDLIAEIGNDLENLTLHELGHAAIGLLHPPFGPGIVMYVGIDCCDRINRELDPDDIAGAQTVYGPPPGDSDGDGVADTADNCLDLPNGPWAGPHDQLDTDTDGIGNLCDCDFDGDGFCSIGDFNAFLVDFVTGSDGGSGTDMDGDGFVAISDFNQFLPGFVAGVPGPAAL